MSVSTETAPATGRFAKLADRYDIPKAPPWAVAALVMLLSVILWRTWDLRGIAQGFDARVYWDGAKAVAHGKNPYDVEFFVTPPSGVLALLPLAALPFSIAYGVLQLIAVVTLSSAIFVLLRLGKMPFWPAVVLGGIGAQLIPSCLETISQGNINGPILLGYVLAISAAIKGDNKRLGIALGIGLALKPLLFGFAFIVLIQRRWNALPWIIGIPGVSAIIGIALGVPFGGFFDQSLPTLGDGLGGRFTPGNVTISGVGERWGLNEHLVLGFRVVAGLVTIAVAVTMWRAVRSAAEGLTLQVAQIIGCTTVSLVGFFLCSPLAWRHYMVYLLPAGLLAFYAKDWLLRWAFIVSAVYLPDVIGIEIAHLDHGKIRDDQPAVGLTIMMVAMGIAAFFASKKERAERYS